MGKPLDEEKKNFWKHIILEIIKDEDEDKQ